MLLNGYVLTWQKRKNILKIWMSSFLNPETETQIASFQVSGYGSHLSSSRENYSQFYSRYIRSQAEIVLAPQHMSQLKEIQWKSISHFLLTVSYPSKSVLIMWMEGITKVKLLKYIAAIKCTVLKTEMPRIEAFYSREV